MITPRFKLEQTAEHLLVNIRVPYAKLNEVDVFVENNDFRFYCKPYYLRLNLPGSVVESTESGIYDVDEGTFKFKLEKTNRGEHFEGLELITKLLTPAATTTATDATKKPVVPLIEELDSQDKTTKNENISDNDDDDEDEDEDEEDGSEWYIEQNENQDAERPAPPSEIKYGFAQTKSGVFSKLSSEYGLIVDIPDPDNLDVEERRRMRVQNEDEKFEDDHYLADLYENDDHIADVLKYKPDFTKSSANKDGDDDDDESGDKNEKKDNTDSTGVVEFNQREIDCLKSLPKKTYLLSREQKFFALAGLVDILYAYCYNNRVNCGETNVESGWTIAKLSSTLSWFDVFHSFEDVLIASFRRSLCFPLYRNWKLSKAVLKDVIRLLKKGRTIVLKKLIEIRSCFIDGDCRYILNDLYMNDYCVWIQYITEEKIANLVAHLEAIKIRKDMVGFDLECVELAGKLAIEQGEQDDEEQVNEEENDKQEENLNEKRADEVDEKLIDFKTLRLVDKLETKEEEQTTNRPLIEELD